MKCFYHKDKDGECSGFWVYLSAGITDGDQYGYDSQMIGIDHNMEFPMNIIRPNEQVYIVDYSISPEQMRTLLKITKDVTWIDHHITAIDKYKGFEHEIRGVRYNGIAACMLTYCYLHHMTQRGSGEITPFDLSMTEDAPKFTKLLADWDVWKFEYGNETKLFQTAMNAHEAKPESPIWEELTGGTEDDVIKHMLLEAPIIMGYKEQFSKKYVEELGYEAKFKKHKFRKYKCFALNIGMGNSEYFNSLPKDKYDILIVSVFNGKNYKVSMYSSTVDVSEIALKYKGGGHKGAAGFTCKKLPFKRIG